MFSVTTLTDEQEMAMGEATTAFGFGVHKARAAERILIMRRSP